MEVKPIRSSTSDCARHIGGIRSTYIDGTYAAIYARQTKRGGAVARGFGDLEAVVMGRLWDRDGATTVRTRRPVFASARTMVFDDTVADGAGEVAAEGADSASSGMASSAFFTRSPNA